MNPSQVNDAELIFRCSSAALKPAVDPIITVEGLRKRGARNPVESAMQLKEKRSRTQEAKDIRRAQKEAVGGFTDRSASSTPVKLGGCRGGGAGRRPDLVLEKGEVIDFSSLSSSDRTPLTSPSPSPSPDFSGPGTPASHSATPSLLSEADLIPDPMPPQALFHGEFTSSRCFLLKQHLLNEPVVSSCCFNVASSLLLGPPDDEEMEGMIDPGMEYIPPPSANLVTRKKLRTAPPHIKCEGESEDDEGREDDFEEPVGRSEGPSHSAGVGAGGPERRRITRPEKADASGGVSQSPRYALLSLYEERMLLRRLEACPLALAVTPQAKRLHRKLLVRQAKRQRGLPLLDIDRAVSATLSLVGGIYGAQEVGTLMRGGIMGKYCTSSQELRILDRFQVPSTFIMVSQSVALNLSLSPSSRVPAPCFSWNDIKEVVS